MRKTFVLAILTPLLYNMRFFSVPYQEPFVNLWPLSFLCFVPLVISMIHATTALETVAVSTTACAATAAIYAVRTIMWSVWLGALGIGAGFGLALGIFFELGIRDGAYRARSACFFGLGFACLTSVLVQHIGTLVLTPVGLARFPVLLQPLRISGYLAVETLVGVSNFAIAAICARRRASGMWKLLSIVWTTWLAVSVALLYGGSSESEISVATVSTGGARFNATDKAAFYRASKQAAEAEIAVWPEVFIQASSEEACRKTIEELLKDKDVVWPRHAVLGCGGGEVNLAYLIGKNQISGVYGKSHPVWEIGEVSSHKVGYPMFKLHTSVGDVNALVLICYDLDFPESFAAEADIALIPSFDLHDKLRNHYWAAQFRAAEVGFPIVKADMGWDSAIIDGRGQVVAGTESKKPTETVLVSAVRVGKSPVDYRVVGSVGFSALIFCFLVARLVERKLQTRPSLPSLSRSRSPVVSRNLISRF